MNKVGGLVAILLVLSSCSGRLTQSTESGPVQIDIIAFNDFHGNLEPPRQAIKASTVSGEIVEVPAGGAAYLASAVAALRSMNPNHVVVSAGDMVGASPLISSLFLDEPTVLAMNLIGVDYHAVGNHEFDRGSTELLRLQHGGCAKHTVRAPCRVDPAFPGARFRFLAANVSTADGSTLFPPYAVRIFGLGDRRVRVGFIGLTLEATPALVTPAGVAGLRFGDEAETVNALVPKLRAEGVDAIVVLIHEGAATNSGYNDKSCVGLTGDLLPILDRLDPEIDVVVSGHTHNAYVCDYGLANSARPFLVTSAGRYGTLLTQISLSIDPDSGEVIAKDGSNLIVQGESFRRPSGDVAVSDHYPQYRPDVAVRALVGRYSAAVAPLADRVVGRIARPATRDATAAGEHVLGNLIADAQLAATSDTATGGAQIAFMNHGGVRADLIPGPDGRVTYGQLYTAQPFGNGLVVKTFTGREIRTALEQQFIASQSSSLPELLHPSTGFRYSYDLTRPVGNRIVALSLNGAPIDERRRYRVAINSFLASGGDNIAVFGEGVDPVSGPNDVDALEAYLAGAGSLSPPRTGRIIRVGE